MARTYPAIMVTIAPNEGEIEIVAGHNIVKEQLDPKQYFGITVGDYVIEIKRKASADPTVEKKRRGHHDNGKVIKLGK